MPDMVCKILCSMSTPYVRQTLSLFYRTEREVQRELKVLRFSQLSIERAEMKPRFF